MTDTIATRDRAERTDLFAVVHALVARRMTVLGAAPDVVAEAVTDAAELLASASASTAPRPVLSLVEALLSTVRTAFACHRARVVLRPSSREGCIIYEVTDDGLQMRRSEHLSGLTAQALSGHAIVGLDRPVTQVGYDETSDGTPSDLADRRLLLVPLDTPEGPIGVLQLVLPLGMALDAADERLLQDVGGWLAGAARELVVPLTNLPAVARSRRYLRLETILSQILDLALDILDADYGAIFMFDAASDQLVVGAGLGADRGVRLDSAAGIPGWVFRTGETICLAEASRDLRFHPAFDLQMRTMTRSVLCLPIPGTDVDRLGVVQVMNKRTGSFDATDTRRLRLLVQQIGAASEQGARLTEALRTQSHNEYILQNLSNGIILADARGLVTYQNEAARRITGIAVPAGGKPVAELFTDFNIWVHEAIEELLDPGSIRTFENTELYLEEKDDWISVTITLLALSNSQGQLIGRAIVIEDLSREKLLRQTISRYLPNAVIDNLVSNVDAARVGISQDVTVLFCDIRKFTPLSEALGPSATVSMLNEYFSYMEDVVTNHSGVIDKYIGDALMALFGAPMATPNDPDNAVAAACDMCYALSLMNDRRSAEGKQPLKIGIGIGTGRVISGNIGSPKRMDFTVIGDAVNRAARIEALTKTYGSMVLICGTTFERMRGRVLSRRIDVVRPRGQTVPTELYEISSPRSDQAANQLLQGWHCYEQALSAYIGGNWTMARQGFEEAASHDPADVAARLMAVRCAEFAANPPADWDGIWTIPVES